MITNDNEYEATQERIRHFQAQLAHLRNAETNPEGHDFLSHSFHRNEVGSFAAR